VTVAEAHEAQPELHGCLVPGIRLLLVKGLTLIQIVAVLVTKGAVIHDGRRVRCRPAARLVGASSALSVTLDVCRLLSGSLDEGYEIQQARRPLVPFL
jgi:hypothetical protein